MMMMPLITSRDHRSIICPNDTKMVVLSQKEVDEFLGATMGNLLKCGADMAKENTRQDTCGNLLPPLSEQEILEEFEAKQSTLVNLLAQEGHLVHLRSRTTKATLMHVAGAGNACVLGEFLISAMSRLLEDMHSGHVNSHFSPPMATRDACSPSRQGVSSVAGSSLGGNRRQSAENMNHSQATTDGSKKRNPNTAHSVRVPDLMEARDVSGMTPLHYASFEGHLPFIDLLCANGADILARDDLGQTPLHWAVQGGEHAACGRLLEWEGGGRALCMGDKLGQTPIDIARLWDQKFLHIREGKSLLEVLANEYSNVQIPTVAYTTRELVKREICDRSRLGPGQSQMGSIDKGPFSPFGSTTKQASSLMSYSVTDRVSHLSLPMVGSIGPRAGGSKKATGSFSKGSGLDARGFVPLAGPWRP